MRLRGSMIHSLLDTKFCGTKLVFAILSSVRLKVELGQICD